MDFGANETPVEAIKEGWFGGTYFRDIYSGVKKFMERIWSVEKILIRSFIVQIIMMLVLINMVLNVEHHQDFGKTMDGLMK